MSLPLAKALMLKNPACCLSFFTSVHVGISMTPEETKRTTQGLKDSVCRKNNMAAEERACFWNELGLVLKDWSCQLGR